MEINKDIALNIAMERIVALENELIYAKTIAEQLNKRVQELIKQIEENNE